MIDDIAWNELVQRVIVLENKVAYLESITPNVVAEREPDVSYAGSEEGASS